jgi:molybdopterin converting factor small subunit
MTVNILIFGQLTDIIGNSSMLMENIADTHSLVEAMNSKFPVLNNTKYIVAVDKQVISENTKLNNNNTVALLPAFSGG